MGNPISVLKRGRQTIQVYHKNFEYYQPNTHKCGDCAIRAVAKALDVSWEEALTLLYNTSRVVHEDPISTKTIGETLKVHGFAWKGFKPKEGGKRPTVADFAAGHESGRYILRLAKHVVCAVGGLYYDIWDCGVKPVYGYWVRESSVAPGRLF